jgi:hypothetical protein
MKHLIPEFDVMRRRYPAEATSSMVLPCLHRIQQDRGFVADSDIAELTAYLGVPRIQVEEVLAHYTQFRRAPIGRWHLQACRNLSCSMRGAEGVIGHPVGPDHGRRPLHAEHGGMPGLLRHRAGGDGQRGLPREHERGAAGCANRGAGVNRAQGRPKPVRSSMGGPVRHATLGAPS